MATSIIKRNAWQRVYYSVTELGLTSGSATIAGIWSAMASQSRLHVPNGELAAGDQPPSGGFGSLDVVKVGTSRGWIVSYGKNADNPDYRMHLNNDNVPDGTWVTLPSGTRLLDSSTNLNNLRGASAAGFYEVGANVPNAAQDWGFLLVWGVDGTIQVEVVPSKIYVRAYTGAPKAWTAWKSITLS